MGDRSNFSGLVLFLAVCIWTSGVLWGQGPGISSLRPLGLAQNVSPQNTRLWHKGYFEKQ